MNLANMVQLTDQELLCVTLTQGEWTHLILSTFPHEPASCRVPVLTHFTVLWGKIPVTSHSVV